MITRQLFQKMLYISITQKEIWYIYWAEKTMDQNNVWYNLFHTLLCIRESIIVFVILNQSYGYRDIKRLDLLTSLYCKVFDRWLIKSVRSALSLKYSQFSLGILISTNKFVTWFVTWKLSYHKYDWSFKKGHNLKCCKNPKL